MRLPLPILTPIGQQCTAPLLCTNFLPCASAGLYNRVETQPGLDHFVGDAQGLHDKALGPLLHWAQAVVPRHLQKDVPLFLLATGGLRRLHEQDQSKVMGDIRQVLSRSGFR